MQVLCFSTLSEGLQPARPPEFPVLASGSIGLVLCCGTLAVLVDVCVETIVGPQMSQGAILKKFLAAFFVRSRIRLSLDDSLPTFSCALETDSNYQDSSDISQWLINSLPGCYLQKALHEFNSASSHTDLLFFSTLCACNFLTSGIGSWI